MRRRVAFKTLGCRLNQFETDSLVTDFFNAGYDIVGFNEKADVYIVNTCTVTNQSDRKSKYYINQAGRTADSDSLLVVTGCMVSGQEEHFNTNNAISFTVDNRRKNSVFEIVDAHFRGEIIDPQSLHQSVFDFSIVEKSFHTRSAVKIQDGCNNYCSYCIVPFVRGKAISRPVDDILENIRLLLESGSKEIVLTGVNISRYIHNGIQFDDLVGNILDLQGNFRIRISSIEPENISDKLVDLFEHPKLCPHLHLCLQSGSDKVLRRMHRSYTRGQYLDITVKIGSRYPDFNFTTDVLVGFPGETDKDFQETLETIRQIGFSHIHTFKYSRRKGTRADCIDGHVNELVKYKRSAIIREESDRMKIAYRRKFLGKEQNVLVEKINSKGEAQGYGEHYIPVTISKSTLTPNTFYKVHVTGISDDSGHTTSATLLDSGK